MERSWRDRYAHACPRAPVDEMVGIPSDTQSLYTNVFVGFCCLLIVGLIVGFDLWMERRGSQEERVDSEDLSEKV